MIHALLKILCTVAVCLLLSGCVTFSPGSPVLPGRPIRPGGPCNQCKMGLLHTQPPDKYQIRFKIIYQYSQDLQEHLSCPLLQGPQRDLLLPAKVNQSNNYPNTKLYSLYAACCITYFVCMCYWYLDNRTLAFRYGMIWAEVKPWVQGQGRLQEYLLHRGCIQRQYI